MMENKSYEESNRYEDSEKEDVLIIANQLELPDGRIIRSYHRHDYVTASDDDGNVYMVDGGTAYLRRSLIGKDVSVYSGDPFEKVREFMVWRSWGKYILLKDLTVSHIQNILELENINKIHRELFNKELEWRKAA